MSLTPNLNQPAPSGALNLTVVRVALFVAVGARLWQTHGALSSLSAKGLSTDSLTSLPVPKGILKLWPAVLPDAVLLGIFVVGICACAVAVFQTWRTPQVMAALAYLVLASYRYSFVPYWSAPDLPVITTVLLFSISPVHGAVRLVDLVRRPPPPARTVTSSINSVVTFVLTCNIAWFYVGCGIRKAVAGPQFFSWAFSDSLRNAMALPYLNQGIEFPAHVEFLMSHPVLYKSAALGHILVQLFPVLAVLLFRFPVIKALDYILFVGGIALLGSFMTEDVFNPTWALAALVLIDFEFFLSHTQWPLIAKRASGWPSLVSLRQPKYALFVAVSSAFMGYYVWTTLTQSARQHLNFPFSDLNVYASVMASPPFDEPRPFAIRRGALEVSADGKDWVRLSSAGRYNFRPSVDVEVHSLGLTSGVERYRGLEPWAGSRFAGASYGTLEIPPPPTLPRYDRGFRGFFAIYDRETNTTLWLSAKEADAISPQMIEIRVNGANIPVQELRPVVATMLFNRFEIEAPLQGQWEGTTFRGPGPRWPQDEPTRRRIFFECASCIEGGTVYFVGPELARPDSSD